MKIASQILGDYLASYSTLILERSVREKALICLLDALGLALSARTEPTARAAVALSYPLGEGAPNSATAWISGARFSASEAAFANGLAVHAHFQDDTDHESWTHPGSLVPPAIVALGERNGATLEDVLRALVAGYSVINWLGRNEVVARKLIARGFRTSPTFGTIAAAAGSAALLGLNATQAGSAVSIAASTTAGTLEPVRAGADEWRVQNGRAAQGGLIAACLAEAGVTGAPQALDGPKGFLATVAGMDATPEVWSLPPDPAIMNSIQAKPYATLGDNMAAAMAAQKLYLDKIDPREIADIKVTLWEPFTAYPGTNFKGPYERLVQTQASTAFAVATMLSQGDITYDMGNELRNDPLVLDLIAKTAVIPDAVNGAWDSLLTVTMKDGSEREAHSQEMPRNLIYQTQERSLDVFERRLTKLGAPVGVARDHAAKLFAALDDGANIPIADVLRDTLALTGNR